MVENELVQIADILPPDAPVTSSDFIGIYLFILITIFVFISFAFWLSSKHQFKQLRRRYQNKKIDSRYCAFEIINLLSPACVNQNNIAWQEYAKALQFACYSRHSLDNDKMMQLLNKTEQWL